MTHCTQDMQLEYSPLLQKGYHCPAHQCDHHSIVMIVCVLLLRPSLTLISIGAVLLDRIVLDSPAVSVVELRGLGMKSYESFLVFDAICLMDQTLDSQPGHCALAAIHY